ncbi:serine threonine protein kinase, CMGC group, partial [Microdochium bolleyi]
MVSLLGWLPRLGRAWKPLDFAQASRFVRLPTEQLIDEERLPGYTASQYYPVRLGEVIKDQYQIVGKLGFGASSTVWLARDLARRRHVALKLFVHAKSIGAQLDNEVQIYNRISLANKNHPGRTAVRELLDSFDVSGPDGSHRCLVHLPLWDSLLAFIHRNPEGKLPAIIVAGVLRQLFVALDYLHTECKIIHTDIKADNIMFSIEDESVFETFEQAELDNPSPRKEVDGRTIYTCRELPRPRRYGVPMLCDFGSAVPGDEEHSEDCQPAVYRAPEVILEAPWGYKIDIWNAGCMVWDIFQGFHLFSGYDPEHETYRSRAHLSEMIALLGPPPLSVLSQGRDTSKYFTNTGDFSADISIPKPTKLGDIEYRLEGESKERFLAMMDRMLQWDAAKRSSAAELAKDEWIHKQLHG